MHDPWGNKTTISPTVNKIKWLTDVLVTYCTNAQKNMCKRLSFSSVLKNKNSQRHNIWWRIWTLLVTLQEVFFFLFFFFLHTRQIESNICVQWKQENPNPMIHRSSLHCFPLERWTGELGFSCGRWTSIVDSLSHSTPPNSFTNVSSLFEHGSVRGKWANKNQQSQTILYQNVSFVPTKKTYVSTCYFIHK